MLNKVLTSLIIILLSIIAFTTVEVKMSKNSVSVTELTESMKKELTAKQNSSFIEIGQVRVFTKKQTENENTVLVVTPWLEYKNNDNSFYEELNTKKRSIKAIFISYFSDYSEQELRKTGEESIKYDLLQQINSQLIMGQVSALYFNDYQFID